MVNPLECPHPDLPLPPTSRVVHNIIVSQADLRAKVMRTKTLLDVFCEARGQPPGGATFDAPTQAALRRQWRGEVVIATYDKRCYSVVDLLFDDSPASMPVKDLNMSHAEYFARRKGIELRYPDAGPVVAVSGQGNDTVYLPAELVCGNELDPQLKMKLPSIASFTPDVRYRGIEEMRRYLIPGAQNQKGRGGGGLLTSLGFTLADELIRVKVTKLELPATAKGGEGGDKEGEVGGDCKRRRRGQRPRGEEKAAAAARGGANTITVD
jgi:hypothetical protein